MLRMLYRADHRVLPLSSHGQPSTLQRLKSFSLSAIEKAAVQIERPYSAWQREGSAGLAGNFPGEEKGKEKGTGNRQSLTNDNGWYRAKQSGSGLTAGGGGENRQTCCFKAYAFKP